MYKHKKLGYVATKSYNGMYIYETAPNTSYAIDKKLIENSLDWVKVENPWKVIAFGEVVGTKKYTPNDSFIIHTISNDKEEFSVGDYVEFRRDNQLLATGTIDKFDICVGGTIAPNIKIGDGKWFGTAMNMGEYLVKKPLLYTTEDGVNRYDYQKEFWIYKSTLNKGWAFCIGGSKNCAVSQWNLSMLGKDKSNKVFSTEEAAIKWMKENTTKPLYTTEDGVARYDYHQEWWIIKDRENDVWRFIANRNSISSRSDIENGKVKDTWKVFSTKKAAEAWMAKNNKSYTMSDIQRAWDKAYGGTRVTSLDKSEFKKHL